MLARVVKGKKCKVVLVHAMKAYGENRGTASVILTRSARMGLRAISCLATLHSENNRQHSRNGRFWRRNKTLAPEISEVSKSRTGKRMEQYKQIKDKRGRKEKKRAWQKKGRRIL